MDAAERKHTLATFRADTRRFARSTIPGATVIPLTPIGEAGLGRPTARETEVLQLIAEGLSNGEIGRQLSLTEETVKKHVQHLLLKLHARNRAHAVAIGMRLGRIS
jgi:DNA-binding NarL/FixJ family response regulator